MTAKSGSPFGRMLILGCIALIAAVSVHGQVTSLDNTTSPPIPGIGHDHIKCSEKR